MIDFMNLLRKCDALKFEIRNPKYEIISKFKSVFLVWSMRNLAIGICFEFRYSNFGFSNWLSTS